MKGGTGVIPFYLDLEVRCSSQLQAFKNRVLFSNPPVLLIQFAFLRVVFVILNLLLGCSVFCAPGKPRSHRAGLARDAGPPAQRWDWDCCLPARWRGLSSSCQACPLLGAKKRLLCAATRVGEQGGVEGMRLVGLSLAQAFPSALICGMS